MNHKVTKRAGAVAAAVAISGAAMVACSQEAQDSTKESLSSASSAASSAIDAGTSAIKTGASSASSAVSSAVEGAPTTIEAPGIGPVTLDPPVAKAYDDAGGQATLGAPTAAPEKVGDGTVQAFTNGTIFSSAAAGTHLVQGEILRVYNESGGPAGPLGFPTASEDETGGGPDAANGGWITEFQHGTVTWLNKGDGTFAETVTPK